MIRPETKNSTVNLSGAHASTEALRSMGNAPPTDRQLAETPLPNWPESSQFWLVRLEPIANQEPALPPLGSEVLVQTTTFVTIGTQVSRDVYQQTTTLPQNHLRLAVLTESATEAAEWMDQFQQHLSRRQSPATSTVSSVLLSFSGVSLLWQPEQLVVVGPADRVAIAREAALIAHYYEMQVRQLESNIDQAWEQTQKDAPLAFEFGERAIGRLKNLSHQFQEVLSWRTRLVRLTPQILVPHVHPPTLASQIGERFRERLRLEERLDHLDGKLDAQERVYELCGNRASEYMVARTGHQLEWIIILLLLAQTVMWIIEMLSNSSGQ